MTPTKEAEHKRTGRYAYACIATVLLTGVTGWLLGEIAALVVFVVGTAALLLTYWWNTP